MDVLGMQGRISPSGGLMAVVRADAAARPPQIMTQVGGNPSRSTTSATSNPSPPNTGMSLVAAIPGTTVANDAFWAEPCKLIPSTARGITVDMGAVRDFFRPVEGSSFCEMLTSYNKHQWSADGETWVDVDFYSNSGFNGGSADWWPRDDGRAGDARRYLSFWGDDGSRTGGCCSSSTGVERTYPSLPGNGAITWWGQPFTLNYFDDLQPLPPNTGMSLVAAVPGTTVADDAFWAVECQKIPSTARGITVDMGAVRDFFRPVEGSSFCEMLTSNTKHQWSADGETWVDVDILIDSDLNGGSTLWWPRDKGRAGDARTYLSFWGDYGSRTGGCCSSSTAVDMTYPSLPGNGVSTAWGQPFTLNYFADLQPLPPNTGMSLVADVPGTTLANDAFWAEPCELIPSTARGITVDMGAVRDFFRPVEGATFCEMLQSHDKHQWSADGETWVDVDFWSVHNGGSATVWPRDNGRAGDERRFLSFWGRDDSVTGGCCSSSTAVGMTHPSLPGNGAETYWGQPFTLNYFVDLQPLPPNTGMSLVADVPGTTLANDAFWAEPCKLIPSTARGITVDMGAVRDFFRPVEGSSFCEMLTS
eukprot:gene32611-biopygen9561